MTRYAVARLEEIEELTDGREPFRPVRHHFGISCFGVNAWTAPQVGDRIINEHDESDPDSDEELYLVVRGRAMFELDGDRVAAPAGTFVFAPPGVKRTAFAEEPETTVLALGGTPGKAYEPDGWELWAPLNPLYEAGEYAEAADRGRQLVEAHPQYVGPASTTSPVARASRAGRLTRWITSGARSTARSGLARTQRMIRTSIRSAMSPRSGT